MINKTIDEILTEATLAGGATIPTTPGGEECDPIDMTHVGQFALTLSAVFHVNAVEGLSAHVRTSPTGETGDWDTIDYTSFTLPANAGATEQVTVPIWCDPLYAMAMIVNEGTRPATIIRLTRTYQEAEPT
ncbi:MAG: hypothetical protein NWE89_14330 [Candidatus Bathyarchaeota archaeon]|nr:hypothetical protein [Candidatus Bathyarchaeota archaeon]